METNRFIDHIDLRVRDCTASTPFYDVFMGALGLHRITPDGLESWAGYAYEDAEPMPFPFFGLLPAPDHRPDASRIAFAAGSREEVDRVARAVSAAGAKAVEGPELCTEYHTSYYAVFFDDPDGNHFEVVCHTGEA